MPYSLRAFIRIWLLYFVLLAVTPAYSLTSQMLQVGVLDTLFVIIILIVASLTSHFLNQLFENKNNKRNYTFLSPITSRKIITLSLVMGFIGFIALMYDKIKIQNINYLDGLALAREQWRELGEGREGVSSLYSVIGYALSSSFIATLIPIVIIPEKVGARRIGIALAVIFILMMATSILTGGRTIILITITFAFAFYSIRLERGGKKIYFPRRAKFLLSILLLLTISYILFIFESRASATHGGVSASAYLEAMQTHIGIETASWPAYLVDEFPIVGSIIIFVMLSITYLSHSAFIFAEYLEHQSQYSADPIILFNNIRGMFSKVGLLDTPNMEWFLAGRFPSLPGAFFHDGGYILLFIGTLTLGFLTGIANYCVRIEKISLLRTGFISVVYSTLFLSPLLFAGDLMSFPFIVLEFIIFWIIFKRCRNAG